MYFSRINLNLEKCDQSNCPDWCEGRMRAKGSEIIKRKKQNLQQIFRIESQYFGNLIS